MGQQPRAAQHDLGVPDPLSHRLDMHSSAAMLMEGVHMRLDPEAQVIYMLSPNVHGLHSCRPTVSLLVS